MINILSALKRNDVIYCGPDRVYAGKYYHLIYSPSADGKYISEGWADKDAEEFLHLLGLETKLHSDKEYSDFGDLRVLNAIFHEGKRDMHPNVQALYDAWRYKTNRKSVLVLLQD